MRTKRRLTLTAAAVLAVLILLSGVGAGAAPESVTDAKYVLFSDPGYADFMSGNQIQFVEFLTDDTGPFARIHLTPVGIDPFIYMPIGMIDGGVNCDVYTYAVFSVRSKFGSRSNLYFGTSNDGGLNEAKNIPSANGISDSGDWCTVVFYCGGNISWNGMLITARFDPYGNVPEGMEYIDIRWMAFVKTEKDLEKLEVDLNEINSSETYTRRPIYATPDRTKPPESTFKAAVSLPATDGGNSAQSSKGFPNAVLIIVTAVLSVAAAVCAVGVVALRTRGRDGEGS